MWLLRAGVSPSDARQVAVAAGKVLAQLPSVRSGGTSRGVGGHEMAGGSAGRRTETLSLE